MTEALGTARFGPRSGSAAGEDMAQTMSIAGAGRRPGERTAVNGTGKPPHERGTRGDGTTVGMRLRCPICRRRNPPQYPDCPTSDVPRSESPQRDWFDRDSGYESNESNVVDD